MYLRSGGIGPSTRTHKRAPTRRVHIITRDGPTFAGLFRVLQQSTNEILLGNPRRPASQGAADTGRGDAGKRPKDLAAGEKGGRVKTLKLLSFHFPAASRGAAETAAAVCTVPAESGRASTK